MAESVNIVAPAGDDVLLTTKLYIPQPRLKLVSRPHLVAGLNEAMRMGCKLTLISAPPGFGKTTLLGEWLSQFKPAPSDSGLGAEEEFEAPPKVAWLSLDEADNEPHRFFLYCVAALQTIRPHWGNKALAAVRHQVTQVQTPQSLISILINEMTAFSKKIIFVLDDYHLIKSSTIHQGLTFLLDNLPPYVHLVISGRTEVPLPLARLRGRGELTELRGTDLRFTPTEVAVFLNQTMGLNLTADEIAVLEARTEGWIAGLQMAALSMRGRKTHDVSSFVNAFSGTHRYILDYLLEEVLTRQPEAIQNFLLQSSVLDRLCGPLCDALVENQRGNRAANSRPADGQGMLRYLEQANLFIIPLDDERYWYRYHHLFADLLRRRLAQTDDRNLQETAVLHRRACDWFEQNGLEAEAMRHALAAVDVGRMVRLARQKAAAMLSRSEFVTLTSWLDALPKAMLHSRPGISLLHAWAMVLTGQLETVETYLQDAEYEFKRHAANVPAGQPDNILGEITTVRATVAYFQRDMTQAINLYRQALNTLPPDNLFLRGCVVQSLGAAYSWCGNVVAAGKAFSTANAISQSTGNLHAGLIALWNMARLQVEQGHLHRAAEIYRQGMQLVERLPPDVKKSLLPFTGRLHIGLAGVLYEWNDLSPAAQHISTGLSLSQETEDAGILADGYLKLARLKHAEENDKAALSALQVAQQLTLRHSGPYYWATQAAVYQARQWLWQENLQAVSNWVQERQLQINPLPTVIPYLQEEEYLVLARWLPARELPARELPAGEQPAGEQPGKEPPLTTALKILRRIINAANKSGRKGRGIEALVLQAVVHQAGQNDSAALTALQDALALAQPEGYQRLFLDEGEPVATLLRRVATPTIKSGYITRLLAESKKTTSVFQSSQLLDPLSEREIEILQLIATGMSNKELAEALVLTVGTVKWHLNNIYSKLGVRSRTQAAVKARELGLLKER